MFFGKTRLNTDFTYLYLTTGILLKSCYELLVILICLCSLQKKATARISLSADHEVRLETLEHQLTRLIHNTVSLNGAYVLSISLNL